MSSQSDRVDLPPEVAAALEEQRGNSGCPPPDLLQAADAGVVPPEVGERVSAHLKTCLNCKTLLDSVAILDEAPLEMEQRDRIWRRIQAGSVEKASPKRRWTAWLRVMLGPWPSAGFAVALLAIALGVGLLRQRGQTPVRPVSERPPEVATSAPVLPLEKAPVVLPPVAFLVWRGAEDENPWKPLQAALKPYESGDYSEAERRLQDVAAKYPRVAEAWFYLGVTRLLLNSNDGARDDLEKARGIVGPLSNEAGWYLAIANQRTGRIPEARRLLQELCTAPDRSSKACRGLDALTPAK